MKRRQKAELVAHYGAGDLILPREPRLGQQASGGRGRSGKKSAPSARSVGIEAEILTGTGNQIHWALARAETPDQEKPERKNQTGSADLEEGANSDIFLQHKQKFSF
jgi:hypothetical protein